MTNLALIDKKSMANGDNQQILPFERYIQSITDRMERRRLIDQIKQAVEITSDSTIWHHRKAHVRPTMLQRREIATIIRRHSGDNNWTADNLFPVEFYK